MKHRLDIAEGYDFEALGLSCHLRDFKLAWFLNRHFGWNLIRETLTVRDSPKSEPHQHTCFRYQNEDEHLRYFVLANRGPERTLLKKLSQFDYFLLVEGYLDMFDQAACMSVLRSIREIQLVRPLDNALFEKIQYQVFEE